ncbi:hypothetical protein B0J18DRAFT_217098 [Chaetomium sp. MPI-SDFR-AT-0129]|nr:hypothetical protein B0J18DRAFT_217098 [Chaetomium sp. MPI-SDFR-AT-0129]
MYERGMEDVNGERHHRQRSPMRSITVVQRPTVSSGETDGLFPQDAGVPGSRDLGRLGCCLGSISWSWTWWNFPGECTLGDEERTAKARQTDTAWMTDFLADCLLEHVARSLARRQQQSHEHRRGDWTRQGCRGGLRAETPPPQARTEPSIWESAEPFLAVSGLKRNDRKRDATYWFGCGCSWFVPAGVCARKCAETRTVRGFV